MSFLGPAPTTDELAGVRFLFTDVDDTLTSHGRLRPETYQALWDLHDAGIAIVPVTGGSAGWCEHMVRAWPVAAVIGESGAFAMTLRDGQVATEFWEGQRVQAERQAQHRGAVESLLTQGFRVAHDQAFRLADTAIDIGGHSQDAIKELASRIQAIGGTVAISSIHINTWIGDYNKQAMSQRLLRQLGVADHDLAGATAFVGDSRNDAPMFGFIRNSFGVANILPVLDELPFRPRWIAARPAGWGFVDVARALLRARQ